MVVPYANFLSAMYKYMHDTGMEPAYVELANEPDNWATKTEHQIELDEYSTLLKQFSEMITLLQLTVQVLGPCTYYMSNAISYMDALFKDGTVDNLYGWSAHAWDDNWGAPLALDTYLQHFFNKVKVSPNPKPVFITEWGTSMTQFGINSYASPQKSNGSNRDPASDHSEFAVTVIDRLIRICGWSVTGTPQLATMFYQAHDQSWGGDSWGSRTSMCQTAMTASVPANKHSTHLPKF